MSSPPPPPSPSTPPPGSPADKPQVLDAASFEMALTTLQKRIDLLQQTLAQQNKLATLGMITAVIAHEFNNILTPMISYTNFALTDKADEALRQKALSKALNGAERMANISKSLLGFARGDETTCVAVLPAVRETLGCLARDLSKDGISLALDVPEDLVVMMNSGHFQQVLMNLLVNARSALLSPRTNRDGTKGGGKRLAIRAARHGLKRGKQFAEISVTDTGTGIPADVLPRIFEPFFSTKRGADLQTSPQNAQEGEESMPRGGTGLGLTICQELIHAAGGEIRVISKEGEGTSFILELPAM